MSLFHIIENHVMRYIKEQPCEDTPDNRIAILRQLKNAVETATDLSVSDRFKTTQAIDSEIAVQRVRKHVTQLDLF